MANETNVQSGRLGGLARVQNITDMETAMAPARKGWAAKWERLVDPEGVLDEAERSRRAKEARSAHMRQIGAKGHASRRNARSTCSCGHQPAASA